MALLFSSVNTLYPPLLMTIAELIFELEKSTDKTRPVYITAADFGSGANESEALDDIRSDTTGALYLGSTSLMC